MGTFSQINVEWSTLNSAFSMNACTSLSIDSLHIEGITFVNGNRYALEFTDSKGIVYRGITFSGNIINTSLWRLGVVYVQGRCYVTIYGLQESNTTLNSKQFVRGVNTSVNSTTKVYFRNCYFTTTLNPDTGDTSVFIDEPPRIYKGSVVPVSGTYQLGDIVYNTNPTSGGYVGWSCTRGGKLGNVRQNSVFYNAGDLVVPVTDNGHIYTVVGSGVSGSSIPTYPTTTGGTVVDGAITLQEAGTSALFKTFGLIS
jgi:hypothetical protein